VHQLETSDVASPRKTAIAPGVLYLITRKITRVFVATMTVAALALVLPAAPLSMPMGREIALT
jgi:hypothetical protein